MWMKMRMKECACLVILALLPFNSLTPFCAVVVVRLCDGKKRVSSVAALFRFLQTVFEDDPDIP